MKNVVKTLILATVVVAGLAFTNTVIKQIDITESTITWVGKKVTGQHNGSINLQKGYLEMKGDNLVGGEFTIDMTSITVLDLKEGKGKEKLEGHLKSDDFFGVATYPTAKLVITNASGNDGNYSVTGDLTIKATTLPITFDLMVNGNTATTKLTIDRSKYDVRYGSGSFFDNLGDKTIYDDFELDITLKM
jgi:polyisoprenoid-binding protein YceI